MLHGISFSLNNMYFSGLSAIISGFICNFANIKVLSGLAHDKLMPVGGWCDKRLCRMVECKNNSQFRLRNGSIEQVPEYANHGLFISFPGDYTP